MRFQLATGVEKVPLTTAELPTASVVVSFAPYVTNEVGFVVVGGER